MGNVSIIIRKFHLIFHDLLFEYSLRVCTLQQNQYVHHGAHCSPCTTIASGYKLCLTFYPLLYVLLICSHLRRASGNLKLYGILITAKLRLFFFSPGWGVNKWSLQIFSNNRSEQLKPTLIILNRHGFHGALNEMYSANTGRCCTSGPGSCC